MHLHQLFRSALAVLIGLAAPPAARAQSYNAICNLADGGLLQVGHRNSVPIMTRFDTAWVVQPNPEGTPEKGEFNAVCTDAAGNIYLAYEDEANTKKTVEGFLQRVNGSWTQLPNLPKGWSGIYDPVAAAPDKLWFRSWLSEERRSLLAQWDGKAYTALPLPEEMKELHTLFLDSDGSLLADGDRDKDAGVYRFTNGSWQPMGGAMDGLHVEHIVRLSDGNLVCNVTRGSYSEATAALYRWTGTAWEPLPGAAVAPKREVEDLCAGPDGRLYLLIAADDEEGDPQRLACWTKGTLRWYKGSEEKAVQRNYSGTVSLYQLACDRTGLLHARDYSAQRTFPPAEFDWAPDGYPLRDADAQKVLLHYKADEPEYGGRTDTMFKLFSKNLMEQGPDDQSALNHYWTTNLDPWLRDAQRRLDALGVAPGTNRLHDAYLELLKATHATYHGMNEMAAAGKSGLGGDAAMAEIMKKSEIANARSKKALERMQEILATYPGRNGL